MTHKSEQKGKENIPLVFDILTLFGGKGAMLLCCCVDVLRCNYAKKVENMEKTKKNKKSISRHI